MSEALLAAGAILAGPAPEPGPDTMTARTYRHPALDGRTVVRLVGATVGPAEDLSMEFLGFAAAGVAEVGHGRRQALGFPAWALVHDPANGRHALALVKDMERLARTARGKPGNAHDGYAALAQRLGGAAPQFLPTFWEQAGRAFLDAGNPRMAGTCFTDARRAEQVHGLVVDEERVRDVHLEFAFGGALTAAMLTAYSREVVGRHPAAEAYELVKTLSLRRIAGGLAPQAGLATDLNRLAKAAGLDAEAEADAVAALLPTYPAAARAHPSVWKAYRKSLVRLGKRDDAVRARLLAIVPDPPGHRTEFTDDWVELLDATGASADLASGAGGPAGRWLERFLHGRRRGRRSERLLALVERLAPRLIAEGGVQIAPGPWSTDLDVLDLCLALGVPATVGNQHTASRFDLLSWARDTGPGRRDLTAIAADPALRPMLGGSARRLFARRGGENSLTAPPLSDAALQQMFDAAGVRDVLADLLAELAGRAGAGTVAGLDNTLTELGALWSATGMAFAPEAFGGLLAVDLPAVLARSLRAGLITELSWPAYERATARLRTVRAGTSWPELVLHDEQTALVLAPDGTITEHVFRLPAGAPVHHAGVNCALVDGELVVSWYSSEGHHAHYWSSRPDEVRPGAWQIASPGWTTLGEPLPIPGGGLTAGSRPLHAGDARVPGDAYPVATDGQAFWRCEWHQAAERTWAWRWREFDPHTGEGGRLSVPAFFTAAETGSGAAEDGWLVAHACRLRPVPAAFAGSPLGVRDGMAGWRVTATGAGVLTGTGIDGREVVMPRPRQEHHDRGDHGETLVAAVLLPGATAPLPVTRLRGYPVGDLRIWTADGEHPLTVQPDVTPALPPLEWWHAMRARDEAGSAALRRLDPATAAALLAVDATVTGTNALAAAATATVLAHLPEVTDTTLRQRIAEVVARTVLLGRRIATVPQHLGEQPVTTRRPPELTDRALRQAWEGLCGSDTTYYSGSTAEQSQNAEQIQRVGALLAAPAAAGPEGVPALGGHWTALLTGLGAVALRAASPVTPEADRAALAGLLTLIAGTPLDGTGVPLRVIEVVQERMVAEPVEVRRDGEQLTVLFPPNRSFTFGQGAQWRRQALQAAPDGVFTLPDGLFLRADAPTGGRLAGDRLRTFLTLLAERGPAPWRPEAADALAAATGMARAEAAMLLGGLPGVGRWEANFLGAEQRALLGVSAAHAKVARASLGKLSFTERIALLDAAMPAEPADLWERGPDVAAIAEKWIALRGRRAVVPDDLVAELGKVMDASRAAGTLQAIAAPTPGDWLTTDGRSTPGSHGSIRTEAGEGEPFDVPHLLAAATALFWLGYHLTWDDPIRAALPEALRLVRERLRNPHLLIGAWTHPPEDEPDPGLPLVPGESLGRYAVHHLATARLDGTDDPALGLIGKFVALPLRMLLSAWMDDVVSTPAGATGDPHDPRVSVPGLVAQVRDRHGLDLDAAAYYLQLLALRDPADKAVQKWNGWKPAVLRKAQAALTDSGLVVAAKRERAGRPVFLPGGWQPSRAPVAPMETWKQQLYEVDGTVAMAPPMSVPRLFATAWGRVTDGDLPRYHDLKETR
ncbi:hypothetical protein [Actinoplanes palleronii]|uniref:DNA-binding protein n=1 Tax=Actinoplanes palleronii TaxID=113570 RepID=A0ABQ4B5T0_9ACTN|nr:hypothetical protein [Actinoplanes palleronii]GIE66022.1 hypothetical protein Apa02nite_021300 [Actinoplanes palleronii]